MRSANWRRACATFQIWFVVLLASLFVAGCNAAVVVGVCRLVLKLSDDVSVFWIGIPVLLIQLPIFFRYLQKPLRTAGMLSDNPERFGPWFK
jgi:hypothetical protein